MKAVILGDFNSTPDEQAIKSLLTSGSSHETLINLSDPLNEDGLGTYRYMGTWELFDQVIVISATSFMQLRTIY